MKVDNLLIGLYKKSLFIKSYFFFDFEKYLKRGFFSTRNFLCASSTYLFLSENAVNVVPSSQKYLQ